MKKLILILILFFLSACAGLPSSESQKSYRTITTPDGKVYNIPAEFPNPYSKEEMKGYCGVMGAMTRTLIIVKYYECKETKEDIPFYSLISDSFTSFLVAAVKYYDENDRRNKFWIYEDKFPKQVNEEELKAFLRNCN